MKKKLIFLTEALWVGGIETALISLLRALDPEQYDVTLLTLREEADLAHRLPESVRFRQLTRQHPAYRHLRLYQLTEMPTRPSRRHRAVSWLMPGLRWLELGLFAGFLRQQLAGERFDGAVIYSDGAAFAASALQAKTHLLVYHHGSMRRTCRDGAAWRRCRHIVAVSCYQAAALKTFRPRYAHKIAAIPNLLDGVWVQQAAGAFSPGFAPGKFHIVTCARLHRDKGVDLAVDACARLGHLKDLHWWVLGGGPEEGTLRSRIRALGLEERMTLLGMQENPCPYLAACDLYVQPSRVEGCPMSIMEALALGKPVLSTDNPGARERLGDGKYGLLCEGTPAGIARGIDAFYRERPGFPMWDWENEGRAALAQLESLLWKEGTP